MHGKYRFASVVANISCLSASVSVEGSVLVDNGSRTVQLDLECSLDGEFVRCEFDVSS